MLLVRALARLIGAIWMLAIALFGLGVALYCLNAVIDLGAARPDRVLHLPSVRRHVGRFLGQLAAPGTTAGLALLCGLGAMALGTLLLIGTLRSSRQRLAVLDADSGQGLTAARPRVLGDISRYLAQQTEGASTIKRPRLSLSRSGRRGRLIVRGMRTRTSDPGAVKQALTDAVAPVSEPFALTPRVTVKVGQGRGRVQ